MSTLGSKSVAVDDQHGHQETTRIREVHRPAPGEFRPRFRIGTFRRLTSFPIGWQATKKDLFERFDRLMRDNKGGIVDFPLRYIEDYKLKDSLAPLRKKCHGTVSDEELFKGAQLAKGEHSQEARMIESGGRNGLIVASWTFT